VDKNLISLKHKSQITFSEIYYCELIAWQINVPLVENKTLAANKKILHIASSPSRIATPACSQKH